MFQRSQLGAAVLSFGLAVRSRLFQLRPGSPDCHRFGVPQCGKFASRCRVFTSELIFEVLNRQLCFRFRPPQCVHLLVPSCDLDTALMCLLRQPRLVLARRLQFAVVLRLARCERFDKLCFPVVRSLGTHCSLSTFGGNFAARLACGRRQSSLVRCQGFAQLVCRVTRPALLQL